MDYSRGDLGKGSIVERVGVAANLSAEYNKALRPQLKNIAYIGPTTRAGIGTVHEVILRNGSCTVISRLDASLDSLIQPPAAVANVAFRAFLVSGAFPFPVGVTYSANGDRVYTFAILVPNLESVSGLAVRRGARVNYEVSTQTATLAGMTATDLSPCPAVRERLGPMATAVEAAAQLATKSAR